MNLGTCFQAYNATHRTSVSIDLNSDYAFKGSIESECRKKFLGSHLVFTA